jgi:hypothetical protein
MPNLRRLLPIAIVVGSLGALTAPALANNTKAPALGAVLSQSTAQTSPNFAGWVFGKTKSAKSTIEYKAPAITWTTASKGVAPTTFVYTGTSSSPIEQAAGLLIACISGHKHYIPYLVINDTETNLTKTVAAGDVIKVTVSASTTKVSATIADLTSPRTFSKTLTGTGSPALQEQDGDGRVTVNNTVVPVVNFGKISWKHGAISSKPLGSVTPRTKVNMKTGTTLQIQTSALTPTGSTANAFTTVWKHS